MAFFWGDDEEEQNRKPAGAVPYGYDSDAEESDSDDDGSLPSLQSIQQKYDERSLNDDLKFYDLEEKKANQEIETLTEQLRKASEYGKKVTSEDIDEIDAETEKNLPFFFRGITGAGSMRGTMADPLYRQKSIAESLEKAKAKLADIQSRREKRMGIGKAEEAVEQPDQVPMQQSQEEEEQLPQAQLVSEQVFQSPPPKPEYPESLQEIIKGHEAEADVAGQLGIQKARQIDATLTEMQKLNQRRQDRENQKQAYVDSFLKQRMKDAEEISKWEPKNYWADKSTGSKITAGIALALGAVGGAMANQDSLAERSIRNAIDKDLEKQKFSLGLKKELFNEKGNIFSMRLAQYKDRDLAEQAARADMLLMADMQISKLEAKMADPAAKAKLQQIRGGLKLQYDQEMKKNAVELAKAQFERDKELAKLQFDLEGKQFDRQMQMREYYIPEFDSFATSKEGAKEIRNQVSTVKSAEDSINQLIKMTQAGMGKVAMRDLVAQAQVIKNMLTGELRLMIVGPGAVTEAEWKMLNDVVRDPTKMFSLDDSNKKALETLKERMYNKLKYKAKSEGITTDTWSTERAEADKTIKKLGTPNRAPNSVSRDPAMGAASPYAPAMTRSNQLMQEYDSKYGMQSAEAGRKQEPTYHETNRPNSELPQKKVSEMYARQPQSVAARDFNGPKQYGEGQLLRDDYKEQSDLAKQQAASSRFRKSKLLVDDKWLKKVHDISKKTDTKMPWLLNIIGLESGFNHKARNSKSSASGLFQLTETGARGIGKNLKDFRKMDQYEQLDVLEKYLNTHFAKMKKKDPKWKPTFSDVYAAILYPSKIGDSDSSTLFSKGSSAYKSNKGMDTNEDGKVTKGEAASKVKDYTGFDF